MTHPEDQFDPDAANYTDDGMQQETKQVTLSRDQIRSLERDAKEGRKAIAALADIRQKESFTAAGLTLNDVQKKAFDNAYEGDFSTESLQQFAADMGWQATGAPSEDAQDMAALDRVNAASAGSAAPSAPVSFNDQLRQATGRG